MAENGQITDRFFLEEIVKSLKDYNESEDWTKLDKAMTLSRDWLLEMTGNLPLTEEERIKYNPNPENEDYYFASERDLQNYLRGEANEKVSNCCSAKVENGRCTDCQEPCIEVETE